MEMDESDCKTFASASLYYLPDLYTELLDNVLLWKFIY